ncbi:ABC transporter permease [Flavilitoribacter nigricans]|uniref:ABC transporter permease n=1 Tax=Flavilitoribacter nigricans (strain ATCC 23147 / DSM 23189 / NBRC 102662 / NCIMB 1420 / SS-2) TaxID=1122177 RepID=A0A2D0N9X8_FLAN2|nr:ABC transporter permease [Flavilitoribacter nigricans]PHN05285.1 hypothetical protein CRP01_17365 [Flavilitoribacter nigricans DSM 23189 = NBRC 102662]
MTVRHQILILFRQLRRFRVQYLISFSGLFLATTTFLLLLHFITYHYSFDRFHQHADEIVRLNTIIDLPNQQNRYAATAFQVGPEIAERVPGIREVARMRAMPAAVQHGEQRFDEGLLTFVDSSFLDVFSFEVLAGNRENPLDAPGSIVLRKTLADKYFPNENPIGKTLQVTLGDRQEAVEISAVVADPPPNSSINFQMLLNMRQIENAFRPGYASLMPGLFTFFRLQPGQRPEQIAAGLESFVGENLPEELQRVMSFNALPLRELYFENGYQFDVAIKGNQTTLISLLALAIITLLMAMINYVNITTALGLKRSREVAVRKIMGSSALQIATNQYFDSLIVIALTLLPAAGLSKMLLPQLGTWLDLEITAGPMNQLLFWPGLLLFAVVLAAVAAVYPALVLARLPILEVLKRNRPFFHLQFDLKKIMLGFQFAVAVFFLSSAWIVYNQLQFLREKDPGFNKEQILLVDVAGPELQDRIPALKQSLQTVSGVKALSASTSGIYGVHTQANFSVPTDSSEQGFLMDINFVDPDFLDTYQVDLIAGRNFSEDIHSDIRNAFILNETAAKRLGMEDANSALDLRLQRISRDTLEAPVIGVVADYHFQSMHQTIAPMVWQIVPSAPKNVLAIRMQGDMAGIISGLEQQWAQSSAGETFDFTFLDEAMDNAYRSEQQMGWFIRMITAVLLFISCSGLYGMMLFLVEQKTLEIGIRKTFGAGNFQIQSLLYRQYLALTLFGIVLGGSAAYWICSKWLENFAYHIPLQAVPILIAGLACLLLGWLSIALLGFRAGQLNPVEVMRES